jgi:hypothetical protein
MCIANLLGCLDGPDGLVYHGCTRRRSPAPGCPALRALSFALPLMLGGLAAMMPGQRGAEPVVGLASVVMLSGGLLRAGGSGGRRSSRPFWSAAVAQ